MPCRRRHPRSGYGARLARRGRREDHDRHGGALPRERVIAAVDAERGQVVVEGWRTAAGASVLERIRELAPLVGGFLFTQVGKALYAGRLSLGEAVAAPLAKPGNYEGVDVWPTVVCDEWGHALGLVWSTRESLARAVAERKGTYWSRSRRELWEKGATSGNTQELVRVDLDCDRDALRFTVRQHGAGFCHLDRRSCWPSGFDLDDLARTIAERAARPEPGSGTTKLLGDPGLLAAKLREEAEELGRASDRVEAVHETADVLYLALVALVRGGGSLAEVVAELSRRRGAVTRRPMAAKSEAAP